MRPWRTFWVRCCTRMQERGGIEWDFDGCGPLEVNLLDGDELTHIDVVFCPYCGKRFSLVLEPAE